jgi:hemerythrin-like metal-binding protein
MFTAAQFEHYKVGIAKLDHAHWNLFDMIGKLATQTDKADVAVLLDAFINEWTSHNLIEESLMLTFGYPYINGHIDDHHRMYLKLTDKIARINQNNLALVKWSAQDMETTMRDHNDHADRQLGEFLANRSTQVDQLLLSQR